MRLQPNQEFIQNEIKNWNEKKNIHKFSMQIRGEKAFAAEKKKNRRTKRKNVPNQDFS